MTRLRQFLLALCLLGFSLTAFATTLDINQADAKTLASTLVGVGQHKAEAIVAFRESNGPFKRVEDLAKVKGIGMKTVEKNRDKMTVGSGETSTQ